MICFYTIVNLNASVDELKIQNGVIIFIKGIILISQEQLELEMLTILQKDVTKSCKWHFQLKVPLENYFYTYNSSWDILHWKVNGGCFESSLTTAFYLIRLLHNLFKATLLVIVTWTNPRVQNFQCTKYA